MDTLTFHDITKTFDQKGRDPMVAVDRFNLCVNQGELVVLLGPSGCGKTTLLRMVAGLETMTQGDICLNGQSITALPPHQRPFAMVFQNYALYPHMTAEENLRYALRVRKTDKKEIDRRLKETMELLRLDRGELARKPAELSGGQRQRVALGRAIMQQPQVFLLDEPFSNLDQNLRMHLRIQIRRIQKALDLTVLMVTHDQGEAVAMADRIVLMNKGKIEQVGPPRTLYKQPGNLFAARFMACPPMNIITGRVVVREDGWWFHEKGDSGLECRLEQSQWRLPQDRDIVLGIRPEFVSVRALADGDHHGTAVCVAEEISGLTVYLHMDTGGHGITGVAEHTSAGIGDRVAFRLDTTRLLFFDPGTGDRLP